MKAPNFLLMIYRFLIADVPCTFGVLTIENIEEAIDKVGGTAGNKQLRHERF
ncbi:hypothetical protein M758_UG248900 [Ceratodon purpureus]|nr:hypothetical protein M758_UG248900 [Ceratodon purpureus]